ncbi:hypothetical protein N7495_002877 [Penicillium taxi]|uniref:uncharacterized protein n=1 Tax=Penicillium taxi TaxID=168475 RepID=UPI0025451EDA|nr:uncharacterized protein N7495_002877 [Penicillium taxi]KAJ5902349.1 hypothetical protein N7495_002877 [Penicillium taxi]
MEETPSQTSTLPKLVRNSIKTSLVALEAPGSLFRTNVFLVVARMVKPAATFLDGGGRANGQVPKRGWK